METPLYMVPSLLFLNFKAVTNLNIGYYFKFVGSKNLLLLVTCTATYAFFITFPQYWLQLWTESSTKNNRFYIGGFLFLSFMSWTLTSMQMW